MNKYRFLNIKYALVNAAYLMLVCASAGYAYNYLTQNGFDAGTTGIIIAMVSICGVVGQTLSGSLIDRSDKLDEKKFISLSMIVTAVLAAVLMIVPAKSFLMIITVIIAFTGAAIGMPFLNSMAFIYEKDGQKINYGLGRGIGSAAYAVGSALLGRLWGSFGKGIIPIYIIVFSMITFVLVQIMPSPAADIERVTEAEQEAEKERQLSYAQFFRKYKKIVMIVLSMILMFFCHMVVQTFAAEIIANIIGPDAASVEGAVESVQGTAFFIQAMVELPTMFGFVLLLKKLSINKLMIIASVFYTVKHILILISGNQFMFYGAMVLQMLSYAILIPGSVYFANENIEPEDRNKGQAIFGATATVGGLIASLVGGQLLNLMNIRSLLIVGTLASALGTLLMIIGIGRIEKK